MNPLKQLIDRKVFEYVEDTAHEVYWIPEKLRNTYRELLEAVRESVPKIAVPPTGIPRELKTYDDGVRVGAYDVSQAILTTLEDVIHSLS